MFHYKGRNNELEYCDVSSMEEYSILGVTVEKILNIFVSYRNMANRKKTHEDAPLVGFKMAASTLNIPQISFFLFGIVDKIQHLKK
jgi:hypothetical protein